MAGSSRDRKATMTPLPVAAAASGIGKPLVLGDISHLQKTPDHIEIDFQYQVSS
jgi:hypothetical protein